MRRSLKEVLELVLEEAKEEVENRVSYIPIVESKNHGKSSVCLRFSTR